jgi:hypothetical protein
MRQIVIDIIAESATAGYFGGLKLAVAERLKEPSTQAPLVGAFSYSHSSSSQLSHTDSVLLTEVFWDLFREGIITLGSNADNANFPHYRPSRLFDQKTRSESDG